MGDAWNIDLVYSGAQKCIGCPPGLSPMTYSARAMEKVMSRKSKPDIFSFDVTEVGRQWGFHGDQRASTPESSSRTRTTSSTLRSPEGLEEPPARCSGSDSWDTTAPQGTSSPSSPPSRTASSSRSSCKSQ